MAKKNLGTKGLVAALALAAAVTMVGPRNAKADDGFGNEQVYMLKLTTDSIRKAPKLNLTSNYGLGQEVELNLFGDNNSMYNAFSGGDVLGYIAKNPWKVGLTAAAVVGGGVAWYEHDRKKKSEEDDRNAAAVVVVEEEPVPVDPGCPDGFTYDPISKTCQ